MNVIPVKYRVSVLAALAAGNLKAMLVSTTTGPAGSNFTYAAATTEFISEVPAGSRLASVALSGKTVAIDGNGNAALTVSSCVFPTVPANTLGQKGEAVILYADTGVEATSRIFNFDTEATGLPIIPNGLDETCAFTSAALTL